MRLYVCLLLSFVSVDPDFTSVFLSSDQLSQLIDLVQQLLSLDVVLLLERLLFDLQSVSFSLDLSQLLLLFFVLSLVSLEQLISLIESLFDLFVVLLKLTEILLSCLSGLI